MLFVGLLVLISVQFGKFMEQEKNNLKFQVHKSKKQKLTKLLEKVLFFLYFGVDSVTIDSRNE